MALMVSILLAFGLLLACQRTEDAVPSESEALKSYNVSKALYTAIRFSNQSRLSDLGDLLDADVKKNLGPASETYQLLHSARLQPLMSAISSSAQASKARTTGGTNPVLDELKNLLATTAMNAVVKAKMLELTSQINALKTAPVQATNASAQEAFTQTMGNFEESIHKDGSLPVVERELILRTSMSLKDNAGNFADIGSKLMKGGRVSCFFCKLINIIVTVAIVTAVAVAIVFVAPALIAAAAAVTLGATATAILLIGGTVIGVAGSVALISADVCVHVVDNPGNSPTPYPYAPEFIGLADDGC
jgi:hypothetical protein